jgi:hypothetical protein
MARIIVLWKSDPAGPSNARKRSKNAEWDDTAFHACRISRCHNPDHLYWEWQVGNSLRKGCHNVLGRRQARVLIPLRYVEVVCIMQLTLITRSTLMTATWMAKSKGIAARPFDDLQEIPDKINVEICRRLITVTARRKRERTKWETSIQYQYH